MFDPNPSKGGFRVGALALSTPLSEGEWRIRETAGESELLPGVGRGQGW